MSNYNNYDEWYIDHDYNNIDDNDNVEHANCYLSQAELRASRAVFFRLKEKTSDRAEYQPEALRATL